jgi:histidinol dehydrogenase
MDLNSIKTSKMQIIKYPEKNTWKDLCLRPTFDKSELTDIVENILNEVKTNSDSALLKFTEKFDKATLQTLQVTKTEIVSATEKVRPELKAAIQSAAANIQKFHEAQKEPVSVIETVKGVQCWRKSVAIEKVGLYIPGGTAPLFSTILMLGIPAKIAGCKEIVLCTPPDQNGDIHPAILFTADLVGTTRIFKVGGAQAIGALTYGTGSVPAVNKIFGPGNQFVTKAKEMVQQEGVAIDMPAGPSEVLVIADKTSNPEFVAADLLSQAEHGIDSQVILLSDNQEVIERSMDEVAKQLEQLPRKEIAREALTHSRAILLQDMEACIDFSNLYAPEHLIIASESPEDFVDKITNAGSVFLGNYSCESAGDYASGTNHTLPTNGYARNYSGVSLDSFVKKITFQQLSKEGIQNIGPAIEIMAETEQLQAHKNAVSIRLKN